MKPVYYLSYSDLPENEGMVFPSELQKETYSTGIWVVDLPWYDRRVRNYAFDAVNGNELLSLTMTLIDTNLYLVEANKLGKFYFRIMRLSSRYNRYVGNSSLIEPNNRLYQVVPLNVQQIEDSCLKSRFFFVGRIDNNISRG